MVARCIGQWRSVMEIHDCVLNLTPDMHVYSNKRFLISLYEKHRCKAVFLTMMFTQVHFCVRHATLLLVYMYMYVCIEVNALVKCSQTVQCALTAEIHLRCKL